MTYECIKTKNTDAWTLVAHGWCEGERLLIILLILHQSDYNNKQQHWQAGCPTFQTKQNKKTVIWSVSYGIS